MAHIKLVKITKDSFEILPGEYSSDQEATKAITDDGEYLFLEAHKIEKAKNAGSEAAAEETTPGVKSPKRSKK